MRVLQKKYLFIFLIQFLALFAGGFLAPQQTNAIADSGFNPSLSNYWSTSTKVQVNRLPENLKVEDYKGEWNLNTESSQLDYYVFKKEFFWLNISKSDPFSGYLTNGVAKYPITLANPYDAAPNPITKITSGAITGLAYFGEDQSETTKDIIVEPGEKSEVHLIYEDFYKNTNTIASRHFEKSSGGNYFIQAFTIKNLPGGFLWEGRYRLSYHHEEFSDCTTGEPTGNDHTDLAKGCRIVYDAIVNFDLKVDKSGNPFASLVNNDGVHEKTFNDGDTIKTLAELEGNRNDGIDLDISVVAEDLLTKAINGALKWMAEAVGNATSEMLGWIHASLEQGTDLNDNPALLSVSKMIRNAALGLLTLVLLIAAFANILNLPLADYGLGKIIPKIIISILMAFFSYLIALFILELTNALQAFIINGFKGGAYAVQVNDGYTAIRDIFGGNVVERLLIGESLKWQALLLLLIIISMFLVTVFLLIVLVVRKAILMILVAIAPLAFILNILPFTAKYYKEWWAHFWKWSFMGIPISLLYYLAFIFIGVGAFGSKFNPATLSGNYESWVYLIAAAVMIFMAAGIPLKMGNEVYSKVKDGWNKSAKIPVLGTPKRMLDQRAKNVEARRALRVNRTMAGIAEKGRFGRFITGADATTARGYFETAKSSYKKELAGMNFHEAQQWAIKNMSDPMARQAAAEVFQEQFPAAEMMFAPGQYVDEFGNWNFAGTPLDGDAHKDAQDRLKLDTLRQAANKLSGDMSTSSFRNIINKENMGLAIAMADDLTRRGDPRGKALLGGVTSGYNGKKASERHHSYLDTLVKLGKTEEIQKAIQSLTPAQVKDIGENGTSKLVKAHKDAKEYLESHGQTVFTDPAAQEMWDRWVVGRGPAEPATGQTPNPGAPTPGQATPGTPGTPPGAAQAQATPPGINPNDFEFVNGFWRPKQK